MKEKSTVVCYRTHFCVNLFRLVFDFEGSSMGDSEKDLICQSKNWCFMEL